MARPRTLGRRAFLGLAAGSLLGVAGCGRAQPAAHVEPSAALASLLSGLPPAVAEALQATSWFRRNPETYTPLVMFLRQAGSQDILDGPRMSAVESGDRKPGRIPFSEAAMLRVVSLKSFEVIGDRVVVVSGTDVPGAPPLTVGDIVEHVTAIDSVTNSLWRHTGRAYCHFELAAERTGSVTRGGNALLLAPLFPSTVRHEYVHQLQLIRQDARRRSVPVTGSTWFIEGTAEALASATLGRKSPVLGLASETKIDVDVIRTDPRSDEVLVESAMGTELCSEVLETVGLVQFVAALAKTTEGQLPLAGRECARILKWSGTDDDAATIEQIYRRRFLDYEPNSI